jgi:hypothetical protein
MIDLCHVLAGIDQFWSTLTEASKWPRKLFGFRRKRSTKTSKISSNTNVNRCNNDVFDDSRDLKYQVSLLALSYIDLWIKSNIEKEAECLARSVRRLKNFSSTLSSSTFISSNFISSNFIPLTFISSTFISSTFIISMSLLIGVNLTKLNSPQFFYLTVTKEKKTFHTTLSR